MMTAIICSLAPPLPRKKSYRKACLLLGLLLEITISAQAFTSKDVATEVGAFNSAFYSVNGTNGYFKKSQTSSSPSYFWTQAEMIETVEDAYEWTSNSVYQGMITNLLNGFLNNNSSSWTNVTKWNDDMMWAVLAFARGGMDTGLTNYCNIARSNYDACYARGWDTNASGLPIPGGFWWTTDRTNKVVPVNGPATIAAYLLSEIYNDTNYYNKAVANYNWMRSVFFQTNSGQVWGGIDSNGVVYQKAPTTYVQGTFLGSAHFLNQTDDAALAARFTMSSMGIAGILPQYATDNDNAGGNAIFLRWVNRYVRDRNLQSLFGPWFQMNAEAAWNIRRASDYLSWCQWLTPIPANTNLDSWDCISSFSALFAANPTRNSSTYAIPQNYIGYWPLDETGGTIAHDLSDAGNDGSLVNKATWVNGFIGGCLTFYGSQSNSYVQVNNPLDNDFTVALWVKTTQAVAGTTDWATGKGLVSDTNDFGTSALGGKFAFGVGNPSTTIQSTTSIRDGNWHYCVATRQQTTGIICVYVDGVLEAAGTGSRNTLNASSRLLFGAVSTLTPGGGFFNGSLDDIKIFNRALSSNEVYALYSSHVLSPATAPANLVATADSSEVDLVWSDGDQATSYNIKRALVSGGSYTMITNVMTTSFVDTTVTNNSSYYYVVSGVNSQGEGANSPEAAASPMGMVAWFRADTLSLTDGAPVVIWPDSGGHGYQAIQGVPVNQPAYVTSAINGQAAVRFNAASNSFLFFYPPVQDDFTIIVLFQSTQGLGSSTTTLASYAGLVSGKNSGTFDDFGVTLNAGGRVVAGVGNPNTNIYSAQGFNDGLPHIATFTRSKSTGVFNLYVDGALAMSGVGGTQSLTAPDVLVIGGHPTLANFLTGDIAEVQIYNAVLSATDQAAQESAIRCKYNLAGGSTPGFPTALTGSAGNRKIYLSWALVSGASTYNLWRSTNNGSTYQQIVGGLTTGSYVDTNAMNGQMNYYKVTAADACGSGSFSSVIATLLPLPVLGLNTATNALTISWPGWATDWTLYSATNLTPPVLWSPVTNTVNTNSDPYQLTLPTSQTELFFQLKSP